MCLHFNGHFPHEPGSAGFIEAKDDGSGGDNWSCKSYKAPVKSSPQQTNTSGRVPNLKSGGCGFESQPGLLRTKVYSAFHPSGVGK